MRRAGLRGAGAVAVSALLVVTAMATAAAAGSYHGDWHRPFWGPPDFLEYGLQRDLHAIAGDATQGRDNDTPGSTLTQQYLIGQLKRFAVGLDGSKTGDDAFKQPIPLGTNILALIPGTDLADQFVVVGAHYDHLGSGCRSSDPNDHICNGATDNAAGVANALAIGRALAQARHAPRRSVILAFWDREEDGLLGSEYYVQHPLRPLAQTVAYVNYDIQGANLLPSLRRDTLAIGAESGGAALQSLVAAAARGPLLTHELSAIFGEGRSDYVNFIGAQVPTVFFSDATGPCYHTAQDQLDIVDFRKLSFQALIGIQTVRALAAGAPVTFQADTPLATYDDVLALLGIANRAMVDLDRFPPDQQQTLLTFRNVVTFVAAMGRDQFGPAGAGAVLASAAAVVQILNTGPCEGFFGNPHSR